MCRTSSSSLHAISLKVAPLLPVICAVALNHSIQSAPCVLASSQWQRGPVLMWMCGIRQTSAVSWRLTGANRAEPINRAQCDCCKDLQHWSLWWLHVMGPNEEPEDIHLSTASGSGTIGRRFLLLLDLFFFSYKTFTKKVHMTLR